MGPESNVLCVHHILLSITTPSTYCRPFLSHRSSPDTKSIYSNVGVLPVLRVVHDTFALNVSVQAIVLDHASFAQVAGESAAVAVEDGALRHDP